MHFNSSPHCNLQETPAYNAPSYRYMPAQMPQHNSNHLCISSMRSVSHRISVQGELGTIRYVGPISAWGENTVAYGVEWDDAARGKNNGDLDGFQYFRVATAGSGSFIKASNNKIDPSCSFFDAVAQRYAGETNVHALSEQVVFGSKSVESYGFQKLNDLSKNIEKLKVIMVDRQNIECAGVPFLAHDTSESKWVFSAESLDLSSNLLTEWTEVDKILRHFPFLQSVNLNGNRLSEHFDSENRALKFPESVTSVSLSATFVSVKDISRLEIANLTKLELASNDWTSEDLAQCDFPSTLRALDVSFNKIETVPVSLNCRNLTSLILSDNLITSIQQLPSFPHITNLDLRRNGISSYAEIDAISVKFPNLRELRINGNPIFNGVTSEEMAFNLIGRIPCAPQRDTACHGVRKLNGSYLSEPEITNAELYFISKVKSGKLTINNTKRWKDILSKHGISETAPFSAGGRLSRAVDEGKIILSIRSAAIPENELFSRVFLEKNTVLRLKGIISRYIKKSILDFSVSYYVNDDPTRYSREELTDDIATLASLGFMQNHRIYVH